MEINANRDCGYRIVIGAIVVGGIFFAPIIERYQIVLLRSEQVVLRRKRSVFGYKERRYQLPKVSHAETEEHKDSDSTRMYQPVLIFQDAQKSRFALVDYNTNALDVAGLVDAINEWPGVSHQG